MSSLSLMPTTKTIAAVAVAPHHVVIVVGFRNNRNRLAVDQRIFCYRRLYPCTVVQKHVWTCCPVENLTTTTTTKADKSHTKVVKNICCFH